MANLQVQPGEIGRDYLSHLTQITNIITHNYDCALESWPVMLRFSNNALTDYVKKEEKALMNYVLPICLGLGNWDNFYFTFIFVFESETKCTKYLRETK